MDKACAYCCGRGTIMTKNDDGEVYAEICQECSGTGKGELNDTDGGLILAIFLLVAVAGILTR